MSLYQLRDLDPLFHSLKDLLQISVLSEVSADGFGLLFVRLFFNLSLQTKPNL